MFLCYKFQYGGRITGKIDRILVILTLCLVSLTLICEAIIAFSVHCCLCLLVLTLGGYVTSVSESVCTSSPCPRNENINIKEGYD